MQSHSTAPMQTTSSLPAAADGDDGDDRDDDDVCAVSGAMTNDTVPAAARTAPLTPPRCDRTVGTIANPAAHLWNSPARRSPGRMPALPCASKRAPEPHS